MENRSALDDDVALVYIRSVRRENSDAAAVLEQIYNHISSHAALRAALIVTLLKQEIQHYHSIPAIGMYTYLLKDSPEALPLLEDAITLCLESWGIPQTDKSGWEKWQRTSETPSDERRDPFEDLLQRVRQHSPITAIKLEQIYEYYGSKAGCFAATALIWLEARIDQFGHHTLSDLTDQEIQEFTYFQYMGKKQDALDQFIEMLDCYRIEQRQARISDFSTTQLALKAEPLAVTD